MDEEIAPLFTEIKEPEYVWYSDKPISLGRIPKKLSIQEFNQIIGQGFSYTENVYVNKQKNINPYAEKPLEPLKKIVYNYLQNFNTDKLVVCKMDEKVGYGVFAREDVKLGDIVAIYSGELKKRSPDEKDSTYSFPLKTDPAKKFNNPEYHHVDANCLGGIARFFQHLPLNVDALAKERMEVFRKDISCFENFIKLKFCMEDCTEDYVTLCKSEFKKDIFSGSADTMKKMLLFLPDNDWNLKSIQIEEKYLKEIACSNLQEEMLMVDGRPLIFFWAGKNIQKGEQLGFDYGRKYWLYKDSSPLFFDKNGGLIEKNKYTYFINANNISAATLGNSLMKAFSTTSDKKYPPQLQKVISCFAKSDDKTPITPEIALRRAAGGEKPKGNTGLSKNINIVKYLLENVENINDVSKTSGMTALHGAVIYGQIENIQILLAAGAKFDISDSNNKTAYDYAKSKEDGAILELFTEKSVYTV